MGMPLEEKPSRAIQALCLVSDYNEKDYETKGAAETAWNKCQDAFGKSVPMPCSSQSVHDGAEQAPITMSVRQVAERTNISCSCMTSLKIYCLFTHLSSLALILPSPGTRSGPKSLPLAEKPAGRFCPVHGTG